jgi:hypothetical protein
MNERIKHCLYQAGLTAQGCWDELDDYAKQGIEKFAELIVAECMEVFSKDLPEPGDGRMLEVVDRVCNVAEHFGVEQ